MDKLRLSVYWENGTDKDGNELIYVLRDDLVDVKEGLIDEQEDIKIEIVDIKNGEITIFACGEKYILRKPETIKFDCWTGYYSGVSSDNQYFYIISLEDEKIKNYEENKCIKSCLKEDFC